VLAGNGETSDPELNLQKYFGHEMKLKKDTTKYHNMSATLGKRKRNVAEPHIKARKLRSESQESQASGLDAKEIFRRHFEAQFAPLPAVQQTTKSAEDVSEDDSEEESEEESEWGGISGPEEEAVEVIEHSDAQSRMAAMSKEELKAFMVLFSVT